MEYAEERKYFDMIEKVGSWSRYQFYVLIITSFLTLY